MRAVPVRRLAFPVALASIVLFEISCGNDSGSPTPAPTNIVVTPGADTLIALHEARQFSAQVYDADGHPITDATVTWSSSDSTVVRILATGVASAERNGAVTITATHGAITGSAPVTVAQVPTTVTVVPSAALFTFVGDTQRFTATVLDSGGSPVVPVQRVWTLNDNTVAVIDSNGLARAKGVGVALVTVVAIGPGGAKAAYASVTASQPVASLAFRIQPAAVVAGEALDPAVQAEVRDSNGVVVSGFSGAVTVAIDSGPAAAAIRGTRTVNAVGGVVSWSGLSFDKSGTYRLSATAASLAPVVSASFPVAPTAAAHLRLTVPPPGAVIAGAPTGIEYELDDRFGNKTVDSLSLVTMTLVAAPASGVISGSAAGVRAPGIATFPNASLHLAGVGYQLRASGPGIGGDTTQEFQVVPASPGRAHIVSDSVVYAGLVRFGQPPVEIQVLDSFGNQVTTGLTPVTLSVAGWPYSAPSGHGQSLNLPSAIATAGDLQIAGLRVTRPGPTALVAGGTNLISDTGAVRLRTMGGISDIWVGGEVTCTRAGTYCVGRNSLGQLGIAGGVVALDSVFGPADSLGQMYSAIIGATSVCGILPVFPGGTPSIACRGDNSEGQLGSGVTGAPIPYFVQVPGTLGWTGVAVGAAHACAIAADSTVACWGRNDHGQLGRGTITPSEPTPLAVNGGSKFKAIAAGGDHTCGITATGTMLCWGSNSSGELGDSTTTDRSQPTLVYGAHVWTAVALGDAYSCGAKSDGGSKLLCWGDNTSSQLGDAAAGAGRLFPSVVVSALNDLPFRLSAGGAHMCAQFNAAFACWGDNSRGQIGNGGAGGAVASPFAITLPGGLGVAGFATGARHTCAIGASGGGASSTLFCWGGNDQGELGDGTTIDRAVPTAAVQ